MMIYGASKPRGFGARFASMSTEKISGVGTTLMATLLLAVLSTLGDWIWERFIPRGQMIHGVVHGAVIFAAIGLALGLAAGGRSAVGRGVAFQTLFGIAISASFYPLYGLVGGAALFVTWVALWLLTGLLHRHLANLASPHEEKRPLGQALARGGAAALLSGLAFWSISGIWTAPNPEGPNYLWHLLCWFWAFLPGFGALCLRQQR